MRRHKKLLISSALLALFLAGIAWHWQAARGPVYEGRHIADWVDEALAGNPGTNAPAMVLKIGAPAVPFIAREGLYGRSHVIHFLSTSRLNDFSRRHARTSGLLGLRKFEFCMPRHERAQLLLNRLGTNAQAAIPDLVNCLEQCPELNLFSTVELQDTLAAISGTNPAAIPYFTRCARNHDDLHAAALAYRIDGRTNLFVEACERIALKNPGQLATARELTWFRDDHRLNEHLVPLLEKMYPGLLLKFDERASVLLDLQARGADATNAIARILAAQTNSPPPAFP